MREGGVVIYPTDSVYAIGCQIGHKRAFDRILAIRELEKGHNFTLLCRNISEVAVYAKLNNSNFRLIKAYTPGPFTFLLLASSELPRRLLHPKRKIIGVRISENPILQAILHVLGEPIMSMTFALPHDEFGLADPHEIRLRMAHAVEAIVDGGYCGILPSTVIDLTGEVPKIVRQGIGDF